MKVYIAGKLTDDTERQKLEYIASICKNLGFKTFLPHKDVGLYEKIKDVKKIFEGDINEGFKDCDLVVVSLDGLHIGAGTAWELGFAYANKIPIIGIKTDEPIADAIEYLSAIIIASTKIVSSFKELERELKKFNQ